MSNVMGSNVLGNFREEAGKGARMPGRLEGASRHPSIGAILAAATIASLVAVCAATMPAGTGSTGEMVEAAQEWQFLSAVQESGDRTVRRLGVAVNLAESNAGEGAAMRYAAGEGATLQIAASGDAGEGVAMQTAAGEGNAGEGNAGGGAALHYAAAEGTFLHG
jgi:hypothetical protein